MRIWNQIFASFLLCSSVFAGEILRVEHIDEGYTPKDYPHIYFDDGRIGVLKSSQLNIDEIRVGDTVDVVMDRNHTITNMSSPLKRVEKDEERISSKETERKFLNDYQPTVLPDMASVTAIFKRMNRRWQKESQCYNRAHVWNYEEFQKTGLLSKKVFIFFTRRYIRNYNFYWWFHAIPTVLANNNGTIVERALDPRYVKEPLPMKTWSDVFVRSKRTCPTIEKYSTYYNNQEKEDCYLHFSSMYFWQPRDLDRFERTGYEKKAFQASEVRSAYREAF